ncbi:hypothetical protein DERF_006163 [Dermatophagoides farinae]|uniref:Uncharacterized protein n=1 Tax=Dermatophagoides farinae TaxID=6954 RepID=A0A922I7A4_DERFA|nr:hypothetical protein DERF_006163 [Dermatophagoides farinae]
MGFYMFLTSVLNMEIFLININAHNYGACSNKYITPAGNKVVYRRFGTFKLGYVLCSSTATSDMTSSLADAISPQMGCVKLQSID